MTFNFTYPQGTDYPLTITVNDELGVPVDLTGYTLAGQAREKYDSVSAYFSFTLALKDQILYPGQFTATIPDNAVSDILSEKKKVVYDIEITSIGGDRRRILEGVITITPEVTR